MVAKMKMIFYLCNLKNLHKIQKTFFTWKNYLTWKIMEEEYFFQLMKNIVRLENFRTAEKYLQHFKKFIFSHLWREIVKIFLPLKIYTPLKNFGRIFSSTFEDILKISTPMENNRRSFVLTLLMHPGFKKKSVCSKDFVGGKMTVLR